MWHPRATKNAKKVDHKGLPQPGGAYLRRPRRRQIDAGGSALSRVTNFALNQAQRAKICLNIGRETLTCHLKTDEPYLACLN